MIKNQVYILTFIICFLILVLVFFSYLKSIASKLLLTYPPGMNCVSINQLFESKAQYKQYADHDKEPTIEGKGTGVYQCYCEKYGSALDVIDANDFCYDYRVGIYYVAGFSNVITLVIGILNVIIRFMNMYLIKKIGYK